MLNKAHYHGSLNRKVFAITLLATLTAVVISLTWQAAIFKRELQERSFQQSAELLNTIGPSIARASWQVNVDSIDVILDALIKQPGIVYAEFVDNSMTVTAGDARYQEHAQASCPQLMYRNHAEFSFQGSSVGKSDLYVCFDRSSLVGLSVVPFAKAQIPLLACVLLVTTLISIAIHQMIVKPLQRLALHLTEGEPLENFRRYEGSWTYLPDEVDKLIEELTKRTRLLHQERHIVDVSIPEVNDAIVQTDRDLVVNRCNQAMQLIAKDKNGGAKLRLSDYFDETILRQPGMHDDVPGPEGRLYELRTVSFGPDADGGFLYVIKDLTEHNEIQLQAIHEGKMSSLGVLSSGIAHDFNNILACILGNTELLLEELKDNKHACRHLETIADYSQRGASLSNQLLSFARRKSQTRTVFPANRAIDNLLNIARPLIGKTVSLTSEVLTKREIDADSGLLDSALMNLLINAMDALTDNTKSLISIELSECHRNDGLFVCYQLTDNGRGIPAENLNRVREPFYTTKRRGRGTGLGMAMVSGFAEQSGGMLEIESDIGVGTTIKLFLPAATEERISSRLRESATIKSLSQAKKEAQAQTAVWGNLLVVEDELSIREVTSLMLKRCGYSVSCCGSLKEFDERKLASIQFDLVLCDVLLDSCSALDIITRFKIEGNNSPFALISGNFTNDFMAKLQRYGDIPTLDKPYRNSELIEFVKKHLQANRLMEA